MGRLRTTHRDLPPRLYSRKDGFYYRYPNGKEAKVAGPGDKALAFLKWAELEGVRLDPDAVTFGAVAEKFELEYIPKRAEKTQKDYRRQLSNLRLVFGDSAIDSIKPVDVATYRTERSKSAEIQANRELSLLSALWNWAREKGYTQQPNPVAGVKRNKEDGRGVYMSDAVFNAIYLAGDQTVKDAMDIAKATGMDCGVILKAKRSDVVGTELHLRRSKTGIPVRYSLIDEKGKPNTLGKKVEAMMGRKRAATGTYLVQDEAGQHVPYYTFADRFDRARTAAGFQPGEYQFRDIRPKVATDAGDVRRARDLLGHATEATTQKHYIRIGKLVTPAE